MSIQADILILGSGFGGSLLSMILAQCGRSVVMVDRARHPRFAIGESSTPLADGLLSRLAQQYNLPELAPLAKYGTWKQQQPHIVCGRKRGFTYLGHQPGQPFDQTQQMLVAASHSDPFSDTHWLRSDVDEFFFRCAVARGVTCFEEASYTLTQTANGWQAHGQNSDGGFTVDSPFVVDATGTSAEVLRCLQIPWQTEVLSTYSRAVFGHFRNVMPVADVLAQQGITVANHPYPCDAAAVHHVLDDGWMWQLPFDDETVSAGFLLSEHSLGRHRLHGSCPDRITSSPADRPASRLWNAQLQRFPFLMTQFQHATIVRPDTGLVLTPRLQRLTTQAAGSNWAALPHTAGFIDPLHSTGIAHTLSGVSRLAHILTDSAESRLSSLQNYSVAVVREIQHVDQLVNGCYQSLPSFRLWCDWCMVYFAAVTSMEQVEPSAACSILRSSDDAFCDVVKRANVQLQRATASGADSAGCESFESWLRTELSDWNHVGLLDPSCQNMYTQTAAPGT